MEEIKDPRDFGIKLLRRMADAVESPVRRLAVRRAAEDYAKGATATAVVKELRHRLTVIRIQEETRHLR